MPDNRSSETKVIARYLVGRSATPQLEASYQRALQHIPLIFSESQKRMWHTCLKYPWLLPHVDAWLAFNCPEHPIRKKLFIMVGVLETQADYSDLFLPSKSSFFKPAEVLCVGLWALIKIATGRMVTWIL